MLRLKVVSVGRPKERWIEEGVEEYQRRLQPVMAIETVWVKDDNQLAALIIKEPRVVCLDPQGRLFDSEGFSSFLVQQFEEGGSRLAIVIGGAEGLPASIKEGKLLLSLSPLTFTHQLTRLVLLEQVYRAIEISKGSPYHKR